MTATDFAPQMLKRAGKNCRAYENITFRQADITALEEQDGAIDKVVAGNVIHLMDEPLKALGELNRVCRDGGQLIIPTYLNKGLKGKTSSFASAVGKAGADFKRQFTLDSYRQFFLDAGYGDVRITLSDWWMIPGTEDLNGTWHNIHVKQWKLLKLVPFSVPLAAAVGGLYWLIGRMM